MAMVQCKECGGQISDNANTCPHCGDVIREPKPKSSLLDLIHKISVPVVLSVAGTLITVLSFFSMEGERQMEQTRKLLADAFDKDPIKQQYCIFYVDHLLASGRISPEMTVSVLSTVAANATSETVRLDALRMMPQLLEQKNFQQELRPLLVRALVTLIPTVTEVDVLRRQLMLDIQTLVEVDPASRKGLIDQLSEMDRNWSVIRSTNEPDPKQARVAAQIKLALLSLVQDYLLEQQIADGLVELAGSSPELEKFVRGQLEMLSISSPRTTVRITARSAIRSLDAGTRLSEETSGEGQKRSAPVFVVAEDAEQQASVDGLVQKLQESGINIQGVDVLSVAREANLSSPENLEIRVATLTKGSSLVSSIVEVVRRATGTEPKLVSEATGLDPGTCEIWLATHQRLGL
ncbi:MAG TPA: zinc ribbon domain-containing protein [Terrimicrobiaceae bacterium]|nr:zinc ribbon domain-containing protein [Terrimicrobiaceae bacterium]